MPKEPEVPPLPVAYLRRVRLIGSASVLLGCLYGYFALEIWQHRNLPIVTGHILSITNRTRLYIERVSDIAIEIQPAGEKLTVVKPRDTARHLPKTVTFRFGGDPRQRIFFPEHEMHPIWVAIMFWAAGMFLIGSYYGLMRYQKNRAAELNV
jgi:hypothetical protein